ncbi:homeobox and C2H2 transcription factor [Blastomyces dermatitidis ER-3]|uniref:Homeobox and C2H2 transcription factor n=1 Tax=Ajellomyces dermatitidis (strain ER-3 / ATCC MYA-2586) TaxID=559297 RepID=A0ABP2ELM0_AJEDR|nr:homeobox and C2H2 transcription factor [Blastomyces dermatitidis ER-3]EEQ84156.2 homeobox and C2H2 transcription factor [Blastomyces dermatitidis ER-3]
MEYFDFEQAALDDDVDSNCQVIDESDFIEKYDTLIVEDAPVLPSPVPPTTAQPDNSQEQEALPSILDRGVFPVTRAEEPCDLCRSRGLDCFMAQRGVMQNNGCTCCISLYRECSFTRTKPHENGLDTLHVVSEDSYVPIGSFTGKKLLRSFHGGTCSTTFEETEPSGRKSGSRFPREAIRVLKAWLTEHASHPYPSDKEKDELKLKTGLKRSQICNWLANARRRGKVRPSLRDRSPPPTGALDIPRKQLAPGVDISELTPLERWKHSPPEHEPASATDIIRAMANAPFAPERNPSSGGEKNPSSAGRFRAHSRQTGSSTDGSGLSNVLPARSVSSYSLDTTQSSISDMSFASAFSHRSSRASFNSFDGKDRRRRRHKSAVGQNAFQNARAARIFQCTFCTDSFSTKYDWRRHEKSLHLALEKWTCTLQGGVVTINGAVVCAFCKSPNPDDDHLESHNFKACQEKSLQERTFYRKDHLSQHLRLMHRVKFGSWMESWRSATTEIRSRCGFCSAIFNTWKDRVDHLSIHFKAGNDMSQWKGDWGFEPSVQRLVENGMPPYLIGEERKTPDPWVARPPAKKSSYDALRRGSNPGSSAESGDIPVPGDANCFRRLGIELSAYISRQVASGIIPTDSDILSEARQIVYGSDDPWNQTCADNPIWLSILKRDNGLCEPPGVENIQLDDLGMQPPFAAPGLSQPPMHKFLTIPPNLTNAGVNSSGFQSPAFYSTSFNSGAPSIHGSFMDSATGSVGVSSAGFPSGGWPGLTTSNALSSSAPVSAGFDLGIQNTHHYLQQPPGSVQGDLGAHFSDMHIDRFEPGGHYRMGNNEGKFGAIDRHSLSEAPSYFEVPSTMPIDIPSSVAPVSGTHIASGSFEPCFRNIFDDHFDMN